MDILESVRRDMERDVENDEHLEELDRWLDEHYRPEERED